MTAHAMAGDEEKSLQAGMNGHVAKPIDPQQLFATLRQWITPVELNNAVQTQADATATSAPNRPPDTAEELPESLVGFDITAGLARLMGNQCLYRKLLLDFGSRYAGAADDIHDALDKRDFQQAHSLVHNLKGLAGNLAAMDLQAAALEIEKLVKGNPDASLSDELLYQKFSVLEGAISQALAAVQSLGAAPEETPPVPVVDSLAGITADLMQDLIGRIKQAAEMGDVSEVSSIAGELKAEAKNLAPICEKL